MESFSETDMPTVVDIQDVQMRAVEAGEMAIARYRLPASTSLQSILHGLPGDLCPSPHWGYVISGRLRFHSDSGTLDVGPGQAFHVEPGHTMEVLDDAEVFEVSPVAAARRLHEHMERRVAAAQGESG
jgi:hypothetical protein